MGWRRGKCYKIRGAWETGQQLFFFLLFGGGGGGGAGRGGSYLAGKLFSVRKRDSRPACQWFMIQQELELQVGKAQGGPGVFKRGEHSPTQSSPIRQRENRVDLLVKSNNLRDGF